MIINVDFNTTKAAWYVQQAEIAAAKNASMKFNIWKWVAGMSPKVAIGVFSILTALGIYFSFQLTFSYDYEDFFPKGDKELDFYYLFRDKFEVIWGPLYCVRVHSTTP